MFVHPYPFSGVLHEASKAAREARRKKRNQASEARKAAFKARIEDQFGPPPVSMETGRSKNVETLYNETLDRLAKRDKNLFRASSGAASVKSLRATTIMMDGNKDEVIE